MSQINQKITAILRDNGLSVTKQRLLVFNVLEGKEPLSMQQLYELTNGQLDRASLYRIVAVFERLGIVSRINIGWKYKLELSDDFVAHHHHLSCLGCAKIFDIQDEKHIDEFIHIISKQLKFTPRSHQFEIEGYCSTCSDRNKPQL